MPIKVEPGHRDGGVDVPTMEEFNALLARVVSLENQLKEVQGKALKTGDTVSLICQSEFLTWITSNGEVKSRATGQYMAEYQGWKIELR